jgi:GAF domain-containing protein
MAGTKRAKRKRSPARAAGDRRKRDAAFVSELREALTLAGTAGVISSPVTHSHLLELIVETASRVIQARAASLCLVDDTGRELVFEVVQGEKAEELRKIRVPIGHGIVGLVAQTGEPLAISNASSDPRHAAEVGARVGYVPQSIVAVPLVYEDRVVGVLELLDKVGEASFDANDIEALALFANLAAIAIQQSRAQASMALMLMDAIWSLSDLPAGRRLELSDGARAFAAELEDGT